MESCYVFSRTRICRTFGILIWSYNESYQVHCLHYLLLLCFSTEYTPQKKFVFFKLERHPSSSKKHTKFAVLRHAQDDISFKYDGEINGEAKDCQHALDAPTFREDEDKYEQKQKLASYHWDEPNFTFDELYATVNDLQKALQEEDQSFALPNREDTISWFAYFLRHMTFLHLYKTGNENDTIQWNPKHKNHMWRGPAKGTWIIQDDDSSVSNFLKTRGVSSLCPNSAALHEDDATITKEVQFYNEHIRTGNEIFIPGSVRVIEMFITFINQSLPRIYELLPADPPEGGRPQSQTGDNRPGTVGNLSQTNATEVNSR